MDREDDDGERSCRVSPRKLMLKRLSREGINLQECKYHNEWLRSDCDIRFGESKAIERRQEGFDMPLCELFEGVY